jgi:hypothetical protein
MPFNVFTMTLETLQCNDSIATCDRNAVRYVLNTFTLGKTAVGAWWLSVPAQRGFSKDHNNVMMV